MYSSTEIKTNRFAFAATLIIGLTLGAAGPQQAAAAPGFTTLGDLAGASVTVAMRGTGDYARPPAPPAVRATSPASPEALVRWAKQAKRSKDYRKSIKDLISTGPTVPPKPTESRRVPGRAADEAAQRRQRQTVSKLVREGRRLNEEILRAGPSMSAAQAKRFTARMKRLVSRMDALGRQQKTAGPAACMKECDSAYPGWGGGKGWNRFWCKTACFVGHIAAKAKKN